MSSLQTVALGLLIVFVDAGSGGWDWIADPVGWGLVLMALTPLKEMLPAYTGTAVGGWLCLLVSVLVFPPGSIDTIDASLGWLFSIPTLGFCFLLCDGLADVTADGLAVTFRLLRVAFVIVAVLPFFVYLVGWDWATMPSTGLTWLTEAALVMSVWAAAGDDEEDDTGFSAERIRKRRAGGEEADQRGGRRAATKAPAPAPVAAQRTEPRPATAAPSDPEEEPRTWWGGRKKQEQGFSADEVRRRLRREREEREEREAREAREAQRGRDE